MLIDFHPAKSEKNEKERGLPFPLVSGFDWDTALYFHDERFAYPERRIVAIGLIGEILHVVCYTPINGGIRVISFRKANDREAKRYEQKAPD